MMAVEMRTRAWERMGVKVKEDFLQRWFASLKFDLCEVSPEEQKWMLERPESEAAHIAHMSHMGKWVERWLGVTLGGLWGGKLCRCRCLSFTNGTL